MTREEFAQLKATVYEQCEKIRATVPHGNKPSDYTEVDEVIEEVIEADNLKHSAPTIAAFIAEHSDAEITITHNTRPSGRYDVLDKITLTATTYKTREVLSDLATKSHLRRIMARQLGLHSWQTPECKLVDLFKEGIISWDDLVKSHKKDCEL